MVAKFINQAAITRHQVQDRYLVDRAVGMVAVRTTTNHSAIGSTLAFLMSELENHKVPYQLAAVPGQGYSLTSRPDLKGDIATFVDDSLHFRPSHAQ